LTQVIGDRCAHRSVSQLASYASLRRALPLLLALIASVALRHFVLMNWDVSWLITVGEKMLAGERFGRDILEINPPASPLLYIPAILVARSLAIAPELAVDGLTFIAIAASLALCARLLARAQAAAAIDGWVLAAIAAAILGILPAFSFSQREHIAVICLLPLLAGLVLRAEGRQLHLGEALLVGLGAGVAVAIKPYFVVAVVLPVGVAAYQARSWRVVIALENWVGAAIAAAYGVSVILFFPDYVSNVLPMVRDLYLPDRLPMIAALTHPAMLLWALLIALAAVLHGKAVLKPLCALPLAASIGFAAAFVVQAKGWSYHAYPMFALVLMAIGVSYAGRGTALRGRAARWLRPVTALVIAAAVVKLCAWFNTSMDTRVLAAAISQIHRQPRMMMIGSEIVLGHPLVRELRGRWVARDLGQWITTGVMRRRENGDIDAATDARLRAYEKFDRAAVAEDIRRGRPDIIVVDRRNFDWWAWAQEDPLTRSALSPYEEAKTIEGIAIFRRTAGATTGARRKD
jgi:hypothetical protein